jgi:hypothetical protein
MSRLTTKNARKMARPDQRHARDPLPVWRLGGYACPPDGANVWTTSYMPGSNVAMANAS